MEEHASIAIYIMKLMMDIMVGPVDAAEKTQR